MGKTFKELRMEENRIKYQRLIEMNEKDYKVKRKKGRPKKEIKGIPDDTIIYKVTMTELDNDLEENKKKEEEKKKRNQTKRKYYKRVRDITKQVNKADITGYVKELVYNQRRDGVMVTAYNRLVIDHKIPLIYGYKNGIPPEHIADISNLQYLTIRDNTIKGTKPLIDDQNEWILSG